MRATCACLFSPVFIEDAAPLGSRVFLHVCRPSVGTLVYVIQLSDADSDFQNAYQSYFSHVLDSFRAYGS